VYDVELSGVDGGLYVMQSVAAAAAAASGDATDAVVSYTISHSCDTHTHTHI